MRLHLSLNSGPKPHPIRIVSLVVALAALVLGGRAAPVTAQTEASDLLALLDGLESAYARKYLPVSGIGFATPTPETTPSVALTTVLTFEDEASATSAFAGMLNTLTAGIILGEPGIELEARDVDGLGDEARSFTGVEDGDDEHVQGLLAVRDGNLGFLIQAHGSEAAVQRTLSAFGAFMVAAEPGSEPVVVLDLGASSGPFDVMPDNDDEAVLGGLFPVYDYDLLANGGEAPIEKIATPSASPGANMPMRAIRG